MGLGDWPLRRAGHPLCVPIGRSCSIETPTYFRFALILCCKNRGGSSQVCSVLRTWVAHPQNAGPLHRIYGEGAGLQNQLLGPTPVPWTQTLWDGTQGRNFKLAPLIY